MKEKRQISHKRVPNNLCRYFTLEERKSCGLWVVTFFQRMYYRSMGRGITLLWRNLIHTPSGMWPRSMSTVKNHIARMYMWYNVMKMSSHLCCFPLKNTHTILVYLYKKHQIMPTEEHPIKYLTSVPQNCQDHKK